MEELGFLKDLVLVFGVSTLVVFLFHRLRQPTIVGFLVSGVLVGPYGLSLIADVHQVELLAEIGVVLLLFTIGLEFSISKLNQMRWLVLGGGSLQVLGTILLIGGGAWLFGLPPAQAVFFGFLLALSSTAIVLKILMDRGEIDSPQGRFAVGMLLFQDVCVVPLMLLTPLLSGKTATGPVAILLVLGKVALTVTLIFFLSRLLVPRLLFQVVKMRSPEIFIISIILICLGTAWATSQIGLSLALGAFLAGMVIADSEYSHQTMANILPLRDSFMGLFFVSVGMLMNLGTLLTHPLEVAGTLLAILIGKTVVVVGSVLVLGYPLRVAALVGCALAQVGEFSFVLSRVGWEWGLITPELNQYFLSAAVISLLLTPFAIQLSPKLADRIGRLRGVERWFPGRSFEELKPERVQLRDHVIIVGYGPTGGNLSRVLKATQVPYCILELNGETVRRMRAKGEPIYYGDVASQEVLKHLGIQHARSLVIAISDPASIRRATRLARDLNPHLYILVRTRYEVEIDELYRLGANEVIAEEFETSIELFARVLRRYHLPRSVIGEQVEKVRQEKYEMLRQFQAPPLGQSDVTRLFAQVEMETYLTREAGSTTGKTIGELHIRHRTGASVVAVIQDGRIIANPGPEHRIAAGEVLVLVGNRQQVEQALVFLSQGEEKS
ncbi:MAG: cation:proton antiporter [candidate division NC10 bacterium]|nr:cation:proton antiporter [candidate division NC10 bacterium]MCZ6550053.1 cation:proton antiporter [candidate division NC10 bacterium]